MGPLAVRMSAGELACTYASMILHEDGQEISEEKIKLLINAAKVEYESYWPSLFAKAINGADVNELLTKPAQGGGGGGGVAAAGGGDAGGDAPKKKTTTEEEEMAPATGLFGGDGG